MMISRPLQSLTLALALSLSAGAMASAQDQPAQQPAQEGPTLADLGQDQALTAAYDRMAEGHEMPEWVRKAIVVTPAQKVGFGGKEYLVLTGCEQHNCGENQIAMLYQPDSGTAHGLLSVSDGKGAELLTWLNIGGGPESIDGRTILFAALTGSLANHPQAFNYD